MVVKSGLPIYSNADICQLPKETGRLLRVLMQDTSCKASRFDWKSKNRFVHRTKSWK